MKKVIEFSKFRKKNPDRFKNAKFEYASTDIIDRFAEIKADFQFGVDQIIYFFSLCTVFRVDGRRVAILLGLHAK